MLLLLKLVKVTSENKQADFLIGEVYSLDIYPFRVIIISF